jgi:hypothetical protein
MIEVELPDGTVVEFPDGTPDAAIQQALSSVQAPAVQTHGFQGREPTRAPPADPIITEARNRLSALPKWRQHTQGLEQSLRGVYDGVKDLTVGLSPEEERDVAVRRAMEREAGGSSTVSRMLGDATIVAPASLAVTKLTSKLPRYRATANVAGQGAIGAGFGALQPTIGNEERVDNAAAGFMFGAGGQAVGNTIARGIEGPVKAAKESFKLSAAARKAATLGQLADKNTTTGRIAAGVEERARSIPVAGQMIDKKREAGVNAWRNDIIAKGTPDGYTPSGESTHQVLDDVYGEFQDRYGRALAGINVQPSQLFTNAEQRIVSNPRAGLPDHKVQEIQQNVDRFYDSLFTPSQGPRFPGQLVTEGTEAKKFESFLTTQARNFRKQTNDPYAPAMAQMYEELERAWSTAYRRQIGPAARQQLKPLDQKYAPFKTIERAAAFAGNTGGDFSPAQLNTAVANRTAKGSFGRGQGVLQQEATDGKRLFMDRLPNTGTADRALLAGGALGIADPTGTGLALAVGLPAAVATNPGKNLMLGESALQRFLRLMRADQAARYGAAPLAIGQMNSEE